jgi:hypothetical protein
MINTIFSTIYMHVSLRCPVLPLLGMAAEPLALVSLLQTLKKTKLLPQTIAGFSSLQAQPFFLGGGIYRFGTITLERAPAQPKAQHMHPLAHPHSLALANLLGRGRDYACCNF